MQGTRVHPQRTGTGAIELRTAETKRPRRSHATRRRPEGTRSPQPAQDQTQRRHEDAENRGRNQATQSRLRQARRRSRHVPLLSLWLRETGHPPRR